MSGKENPFLNESLANYPLEILVDQNLREDGIVKDFGNWPTAHLLHLFEILTEELKDRDLYESQKKNSNL